ncbi:GTP-binding protein [Marinicella meishanensis]|uniref:GTP-binding protein n=1 Tax=Marinicella meishanensis TaxID=2873263 RepID=UPI001CBD02FC|nr:GTP-binding protein [Marinicella sp. NBU2979]
MRQLLNDPKIPAVVKEQLSHEYANIQRLIDKLEQEQIHIVAFGKVSTGKSSLLNAISGQPHFQVSPLHGETKHTSHLDWPSYEQQSVVLIDTPGTDEFDGEEREVMAQQAAKQADVILFVLDGDLSESQKQQLEIIAQPNKPLIVVLNKADLYTHDEIERIKASIEAKTQHLNKRLVAVSADPRARTLIVELPDGSRQEKTETPPAHIDELKQLIWELLDKEGKTITALNASLFAGEVSEDVAKKIIEVRKTAGQKIIRTHCMAKGIGVAFNPIPVADLLLAAGLDVAMIRQLSKLYGLSLGKVEATKLTTTIMAQLAVLMGAVWGVNLLSSAMKTVSAGLSTTLTATAQGSLAYYATYLVGQIAEYYFIQGNSWGKDGPKTVAKNIVKNLDRNSILLEAREQILQTLNKSRTAKPPDQ